jgi:DNA-binding transcriptional regulator LsrR (DeoR family)
MTRGRRRPIQEDRLYRTDKEERTYRELKQRYGFKDAVVVKSQRDDEGSEQLRSAKDTST